MASRRRADLFADLAGTRLAIEPVAAGLAAGLAAGRADAAAEMRQTVERLAAAADRRAFALADVDLHRQIARAPGNVCMPSASALIETALVSAFWLSSPAEDPPVQAEVAADHGRLVEAIARADAPAAEAAMRRVIIVGRDRVASALQGRGVAPVRRRPTGGSFVGNDVEAVLKHRSQGGIGLGRAPGARGRASGPDALRSGRPLPRERGPARPSGCGRRHPSEHGAVARLAGLSASRGPHQERVAVDDGVPGAGPGADWRGLAAAMTSGARDEAQACIADSPGGGETLARASARRPWTVRSTTTRPDADLTFPWRRKDGGTAEARERVP